MPSLKIHKDGIEQLTMVLADAILIISMPYLSQSAEAAVMKRFARRFLLVFGVLLALVGTRPNAVMGQATEADKATADKATADKATADKATADKATAKKATAKKATAKKATAKKAAADALIINYESVISLTSEDKAALYRVFGCGTEPVDDDYDRFIKIEETFRSKINYRVPGPGTGPGTGVNPPPEISVATTLPEESDKDFPEDHVPPEESGVDRPIPTIGEQHQIPPLPDSPDGNKPNLNQTTMSELEVITRRIADNLDRADQSAASLEKRLGGPSGVAAVGGFSPFGVAAAQTPEEVDKIHFISVVDSRPSQDVGFTENARFLEDLIVNQAGNKLSAQSRFGSRRVAPSIQDLRSAVANCKIGPNDDIIIIFETHGVYNGGHQFDPGLGSRQQCWDVLDPIQARQKIVISDSCSPRSSLRGGTAVFTLAPTAGPRTNALGALLTYGRGVIDVNGASPPLSSNPEIRQNGEFGIYTRESNGAARGGFFSRAFYTAALTTTYDSSTPLTWRRVFNETQRLMEIEFRQFLALNPSARFQGRPDTLDLMQVLSPAQQRQFIGNEPGQKLQHLHIFPH